jgi:hypothetical protein
MDEIASETIRNLWSQKKTNVNFTANFGELNMLLLSSLGTAGTWSDRFVCAEASRLISRLSRFNLFVVVITINMRWVKAQDFRYIGHSYSQNNDSRRSWFLFEGFSLFSAYLQSRPSPSNFKQRCKIVLYILQQSSNSNWIRLLSILWFILPQGKLTLSPKHVNNLSTSEFFIWLQKCSTSSPSDANVYLCAHAGPSLHNPGRGFLWTWPSLTS